MGSGFEMDKELTTPEEYEIIRQEHIVNRIYGGDDKLPLETKEERLMDQYDGNRANIHTTLLDENGRNFGENHTRFYQRVKVLEISFLHDRDLIRLPMF